MRERERKRLISHVLLSAKVFLYIQKEKKKDKPIFIIKLKLILIFILHLQYYPEISTSEKRKKCTHVFTFFSIFFFFFLIPLLISHFRMKRENFWGNSCVL